MKRCINCGKELADTTNFCGKCGAKQETYMAEKASEMGKVCPSCQSVNSPKANFCSQCRQRLTPVYDTTVMNVSEKPSVEAEKNIQKERGYITWKVLPGQLAVKIDEKEIDSYGLIQGVYVAPGTRALFFVNGKLAAQLDSGKYSFGEMREEARGTTDAQTTKGVISFLRNISRHISNGVSTLLGLPGKPFYTVILCRGDEFPLIYEFKDVLTSTVRCDVGLHLVGKITNIESFAECFLTDRQFVSVKHIVDTLEIYVRTIVNQTFYTIDLDRVNQSVRIMNELVDMLSERVQKVYPFFDIVQILSIAANNEDLDRIRFLKEELYINEQELEQIQLRNDFLNRLQDTERSNALRNARSAVDYQTLLDDIELDGMRNADRKEAAILMLEAEKQLRIARTQEEVQQAFDKLNQSRMLSREELSVLKEQIDYRAAMVQIGHGKEITMANLEVGQLIAMATLQNEIALDGERLRWELEIGNKRFENILRNQRMQEEFEEWKKNNEFEREQKEQSARIDTLEKVLTIKNNQANAEHKRKLEWLEAERETKKAENAHEEEMTKIMSMMTAEQIMAMNPNISPAAAAAFAEKFKAQAAGLNNDQVMALQNQFMEYIKGNNQQLMDLLGALIQSTNQAQAARLHDKDEEITRAYKVSENNSDRVVNSVGTAVRAVASQSQPVIVTPPVGIAPVVPTVIQCPKCGNKTEKGDAFCEVCGTDLKQ